MTSVINIEGFPCAVLTDGSAHWLRQTVLGTLELGDKLTTEELPSPFPPQSPLPASVVQVGNGWMWTEDMVAFPTMVASASLRGFVVPDHPDDNFERGDNADPFVRDTHAAVADFDNWAPGSEALGQRYKATVDRIAADAAQQLDEERFRAGRSGET